MNKKGFTLIELLAVIIILAIIALIAVPTILNIIASSKKKALEDTAYGMIRAGELYYAENSLIGNNIEKTFDGPNYTDLNFKGEKITNGSVTVTEDGEVSIWLYKDGYCVYKDASDNKVSTKEVQSIDGCKKSTIKPICFTSESEELLYLPGTSYTCNPGDGETRTFYLLEDGGDVVSLIMDRNIGGMVAWISSSDYAEANIDGTKCVYGACNDEGPITARNYLAEVTADWKDVSVSLPSGQQIANAGKLWNWTLGGSNQSGLPNWLYKNLNCSVKTCNETISMDNILDNRSVNSYWTSSRYINHSGTAWYVYDAGYLNLSLNVGNEDSTGVRPVITLSKFKLSGIGR